MNRTARYSIYKEMLARIEATPIRSITDKWGDYSINFCLILADIGNRVEIEELPELMAKKPEAGWPGVTSPYWYHPYDRIRVAILKEVIATMELPWYNRFLRFLHIK